MCLEGGCGVCIVTLKGIHPVTKQSRTWAVNSVMLDLIFCCYCICIFKIFSAYGRYILVMVWKL